LPTRHAWNDNNYEGKLLRSAISKLAKRLKKSDDLSTDELIKIINCMATASNAKKGLSEYEHYNKKLDHVLSLLKERELVKYNIEAKDDIKHLPRPQD
jgi:hypothetical protein